MIFTDIVLKLNVKTNSSVYISLRTKILECLFLMGLIMWEIPLDHYYFYNDEVVKVEYFVAYHNISHN